MEAFNRFDLNLLTVFEAIYTRGGVSGAARHLNLSQPAISHALVKLRDAFGDRLFVRHGNGLVPTARAHALIAPVREALGSVSRALAGPVAFDPSTATRNFAIGLRPSGEFPGFAGFVAEALAAAPGIGITSRFFSRRALATALAGSELDFAIDVSGMRAPGLSWTRLWTDPLVVVTRGDHPLVGRAMTMKDYLGLDHVFVSPRPSGLGVEDAALAGLGHVRRIKVRCQHALTAWRIVSASTMACTLPRSHANALASFGDNRVVDLPFPAPSNEVSLYWHEAADADLGAAWLRQVAERHLGAAAKSDQHSE